MRNCLAGNAWKVDLSFAGNTVPGATSVGTRDQDPTPPTRRSSSLQGTTIPYVWQNPPAVVSAADDALHPVASVGAAA
jgi:hypothetical protein